MEFFSLGATFFIGIGAAWLGAQVGGGGLLTIPILIFLGLPPQIAIATNKFGSVGLQLGAGYRFLKSGDIQWHFVIPFSVLSITAAFIGSTFLINVDTSMLTPIVGITLLVLLPLLLFRRTVGITKRETSPLKKSLGYLAVFLAHVWGSFFGAGYGPILFTILITTFGFTMIEASATNKIPGLLQSLISLILFMVSGIVNYGFGISLMLGMGIGGWLGAHTAIQKGNAWVKGLFATVVLISALKLLL